MRTQGKKDIIAIFCITVAILLFFIRFMYPTPQIIITPDFGQSDALGSYSFKSFLATELKSGHIPLWTSRLGGGYPLYASGVLSAWYLPNIVLLSVFPMPYAYLLSLLLAGLLLGWGMYAWLRSMKLGILASIFGALTVALSGYVIVQFVHFSIVQSLSLFPFLACIIHRLSQKTTIRLLAVYAFVLNQLICISFFQIIFISLFFLSVYYIWLISNSKRVFLRIFQFVGATLIGIGLSAIQLIPSIEYLKFIDTSATQSPGGSTIFSFPWKQLLTFIHPYILGNPTVGTYPHFAEFGGSIFWENTNYIGIIPILNIIAVTFLICFAKNTMRPLLKVHGRSILFFSLIAIVSLLLMTGRHSPFYFVFSFWPFTLFRVPSRFIWIFICSLIVLSSISFQIVLSVIKHQRLRMLTGIFFISIHVLTLFIIWSPYHNIEPAGEWLKAPSFSQYLSSEGKTYSIAAERLFNNTYSDLGWYRADPLDHPSYILRNTFTPDKSMLWGVSQLTDYTGRSLKRPKVFSDLLSQSITISDSEATVSAFGEKILSLLNVKNVISALPLTQKGMKIIAELRDPSHQIILYNNPKAVPKAYIASKTMTVTTVDEAVKAMSADTFIPGSSILTETEIKIEEMKDPPFVQIKKSEEGKYEFFVAGLTKQAVFVLTETYYPGWEIVIDGKEQPIFPVNITHIGAVVPEGTHTIVAEFKSKSYRLGATISLITGLFIMIVILSDLFVPIFYTRRKIQ